MRQSYPGLRGRDSENENGLRAGPTVPQPFLLPFERVID